MIHELKCWCEPFKAIKSRKKKFEYRLNDRNYNVGDILYLREWDPDTKDYTGDCTYQGVPYILKNGFGLPEGYCIMSIEPTAGW